MNQFPEMTEKQRDKFKSYLLIKFVKPYHQIDYSMEFLEGIVGEIGFGMFIFTRTNQDNILVKTTLQIQEGSEKSNLLDIFSLN